MTSVAASRYVVAYHRVETDSLDSAQQVPRRPIEMLAIPLVHVRPDHMPVSTVKFSIDVDQGLDEIVPGRQVTQGTLGEPRRRSVDDRGLSGFQLMNVDCEEGDAA